MSSEKPYQDPLPIYYLRDRVEKWGTSGDSVVIIPKSASFDELHVRRVFLQWGFGEFKWQFTGFITVVPKEQINEKSVRLYRTLKNLETDLKWEGLLLRKPFFAASASLRNLALHIEGLRPNEELAQKLNSNHQILDLVRRVKPDLLRIRLESVQMEDTGFSSPDETEPVHLIRRYYEKPYRVMWLIAVTRMNLPNPWIGGLMKDSYALLDAVAESVRKETDEVKASIENP